MYSGGGFFLTGTILVFSAAFSADAAKYLYLLSLDAKEGTVQHYEGELTAQKAHFLLKGADFYCLDNLWLADCIYTPETEWVVGETYEVEYLPHTGYIMDSTFVLNSARLCGHALSSTERQLFPAIDLPQFTSLAAVKSAVYRMVSVYWQQEGNPYGYDLPNNPCSIAAFYSEQTGQYLCKLYQPGGDFSCWLVLDINTGEVTHFWAET